jgi:protein TonB
MRERSNRLITLTIAAAIHVFLLFFLVFRMETAAVTVSEPSAQVMKLTDFEEYTPAPPPPPPLAEIPPVIAQNTVEAVAETMVETDELPPDMVVVDVLPSSGVGAPGGVPGGLGVPGAGQEVYLSQGRISVIPVLPDDKIRQAVTYPPIALRSGVEGMVYLELFIDRHGEIKQISILREDPAGRGFGDAAVKAFSGITAMSPAFANGVAVGVRYRYPVRFSIKN